MFPQKPKIISLVLLRFHFLVLYSLDGQGLLIQMHSQEMQPPIVKTLR